MNMQQIGSWTGKKITVIAAYLTSILSAQIDLMHPTSIGNPIADGNKYFMSSP